MWTNRRFQYRNSENHERTSCGAAIQSVREKAPVQTVVQFARSLGVSISRPSKIKSALCGSSLEARLVGDEVAGRVYLHASGEVAVSAPRSTSQHPRARERVRPPHPPAVSTGKQHAPRAPLKMLEYDAELSERLGLPAAYTDPNNNSDSDKSSRGDKYSLRPRSARRRGLAEDAPAAKRQAKPKQKPAPLSKYRRKTANARERSRMREINQAFEALRRAVPQMSVAHQANEKLTKITTLRLAMKYISALSAVLSSNEPAQDLLSDCSELDCFLLESDGESLPLHSDFSDHSLTPADFSVDFPDDSLAPVDFEPLSPDLGDHLSHFDPFLAGFS
ncbi:HLH domain containing protein [Asbolus verrucosus]|uniref:HLH domain containing protein n=1 Tax=Asbolus verrucosus TaxID=1661398 RepID=A0A482W0S6_ASBVE|nr:HLH domain containing protein [Asbolus verrucosus]